MLVFWGVIFVQRHDIFFWKKWPAAVKMTVSLMILPMNSKTQAAIIHPSDSPQTLTKRRLRLRS